MISKKKAKEIRKNLKKGEKLKTNKHTNKIEIKFNYEKNNPMPIGIEMRSDCTMVDKILAMIRLMDNVCINAAEEGKSISEFFVACLKAYIDQCEIQ